MPALRLMIETGVLAEVIPGPVALERLARLIELAPRATPAPVGRFASSATRRFRSRGRGG